MTKIKISNKISDNCLTNRGLCDIINYILFVSVSYTHLLERLIADLTEDIKTRFLNSFEEINKSFKEIFVSIFGDGAHGELKLTDPEDVYKRQARRHHKAA